MRKNIEGESKTEEIENFYGFIRKIIIEKNRLSRKMRKHIERNADLFYLFFELLVRIIHQERRWAIGIVRRKLI